MDVSSKRAGLAAPSGEPPAKHHRDGLTEQPRLRFSEDDQVLLSRSLVDVKKFTVPEVQKWAEAALIAAGYEGSIDDLSSEVGTVVTVFKTQMVRGSALVELTSQKLTNHPYSIAGGPAEVLAKRIAEFQGRPPETVVRL
jgi:hypothetical protein